MTLFENKRCSPTVLTNCLNKTPALFTMLGKYFLNFRLRNRAVVVFELVAFYYFVLVSHKPFVRQVVYQFSKVEKKIVVNQQNSCKGSQCNRVDPITNPLNSGVTL